MRVQASHKTQHDMGDLSSSARMSMMLMEWQVISVRTRPNILMVTKRTSRPSDDNRKPMTAPARNAALRMASQHASLTRWQGGIQLGSQHALDTFNAVSGRSQTEAAVAS